jgi:hypothetical protein
MASCPVANYAASRYVGWYVDATGSIRHNAGARPGGPLAHIGLPVPIAPPQSAADVAHLLAIVTDVYVTTCGTWGLASYVSGSKAGVRAAIAEQALAWVVAYGTDPWVRSEARLENFRGQLAPMVGRALGDRNAEGLVVGLSQVVLGSTVIDATAWPMLWVWANGGPTGKGSPRTRVFAMKALQALIARRRGIVTPAVLSQVEALQRTIDEWDRLWPTFGESDVQERALFVAEANSLVAATATELAQQGVDISELHPAAPPPRGEPFPYIPVLGAGVAAVLAIAAAIGIRDRRTPRRRRR